MHAALLAAILMPAAGDVSGLVRLSNGRPAREAVVYLKGDARPRPLAKVVIDQRDRMFLPHVSVVTVGTKVDFPNNDTVFHNVFTEYHSERFDFGMYPRGKSKKWTFDREGLAVLLCSIHPEMSAYVVCVDTPYYAMTDRTGRFSIPGVPAGEYTLRVWHESGERLERRQRVESGANLPIQTSR